PELRGEITPERIGQELAAWLDDELRRATVRRELEALRGPTGAARRVAEQALDLARGVTGTRAGGSGDSNVEVLR
ncbi:MAG TPA: hypothetical protein VIL08_05485, partial [Limnochorda sp.]